MSQRRPLSRHQRTITVTGILCIVLTLVLMQLWLLMATMNAWLGGDESVVWRRHWQVLPVFQRR